MNLTERKTNTPLGTVFLKKIKLSERQRVFMTSNQKGEEYYVPALLSVAVTDGDGIPVMTMDEWDDFGAEHPSEVLPMFYEALSLNKISAEDSPEKE
ncbi:hypothetical protein [Hahella ganghwensis]|uniref:hypothetical protein n=1 Tax=Hahella ganghwensis TaxID=286420 RepID=UPI0003615A29|nr:hypothetical protein [Hahella ganghwensis]